MQTITFAEVLASVTWPQLKASLLWLRADIGPELRDYQKVFRQLKRLTPVVESMRIYVEERKVQDDDEVGGLEVVGRDGTLNRELDDFQYLGERATEDYGAKEVVWSLCLKPGANWLGMKVASETLDSLSLAQIAAHCLWELTFHGFVESDVEEFNSELHRRVAEIDSMTKEEKANRLRPIDEVLARIEAKLEEVPKS